MAKERGGGGASGKDKKGNEIPKRPFSLFSVGVVMGQSENDSWGGSLRTLPSSIHGSS